jgi:hypothetical protein
VQEAKAHNELWSQLKKNKNKKICNRRSSRPVKYIRK